MDYFSAEGGNASSTIYRRPKALETSARRTLRAEVLGAQTRDSILLSVWKHDYLARSELPGVALDEIRVQLE